MTITSSGPDESASALRPYVRAIRARSLVVALTTIAALGVAASALVAVLLYRYVDLGSLGPVPDMYENTWQVPGKLLSAYAEGAAVVLAGLGLLTHRKHPGTEPLLAVAATEEKRG